MELIAERNEVMRTETENWKESIRDETREEDEVVTMVDIVEVVGHEPMIMTSSQMFKPVDRLKL